MAIWKKFHKDGIPEYLARNYWWAYVWSFGIWFWDHQPIVNMILFGNYRKLINATVARYRKLKPQNTLQISGVYGRITPELALELKDNDFHLVDITNGQLVSARKKLAAQKETEKFAGNLSRMNAENMAYPDNSFDSVLIFFLLHELPPDVRKTILAEAVRVVKPGGSIIVTEYGERTKTHFFHTFFLSRWILGYFEPFVPAFIAENLTDNLNESAKTVNKEIEHIDTKIIFRGFYRNAEFKVK
ncbi:MAG: methyltransferase domain-containing protein [Gammaproteobacteria bacterium]|nr:MAG: methyltransferase domain-containing protein [Gammaproteobacteria bacterium]